MVGLSAHAPLVTVGSVRGWFGNFPHLRDVREEIFLMGGVPRLGARVWVQRQPLAGRSVVSRSFDNQQGMYIGVPPNPTAPDQRKRTMGWEGPSRL